MKASKNPYQKHIFVCTHRRDDGEVSCAHGGEEICEALKTYVKDNGLKGKVRVSSSGCMDFCAQGPNVMVFPDCVWYRKVTLQDLEQIIQEHLACLKEKSISGDPQ